MESTVQIRTIEELHQELHRLELLVESDPDVALQSIGEGIADWEMLVRKTFDFPLALRIGELLEKAKHFWLALNWYQWAVEADDASPDLTTISRVMRSKGRIYIRLGMHQDALRVLQRVEELGVPDTADSMDLPTLWQNLSMVHSTLGQFDESIQYAERALHRFQEKGDTHRVCILEFMIGSDLKSLKRFEDSCEYLTRSRKGMEQHKDYFHLARSWHNYAELMRDWGRMEEAVAAWRMSLEMKKRTKDHAGQVNTLLSITKYFISRQEWHSALRYVTQAFPLCHPYRLHDQEVKSLDCWATILYELGRYSELEVVATRATYLLERVAVKHHVIMLLHKVTEYFRQIGRNDLAGEYGSKAVQNQS
ncbi:tetratricopeptide repeat protein [Tumebacillus permanentifrigoris]|uniref:Tetratricopeptide repeat protein n=1 Tax=Tumebacillus permanentifrigoris TaxID=378543 RepID=A0A316DA05_9BACL|nr:tetratricopeptide repeat protein [Tumebacillus permanentifrigoris]PWK13799.1 tetratricopeptide repeat protein [Tumebacillus permanentifrigoris]